MMPENVEFNDFKYQYPSEKEFDEFSKKITRFQLSLSIGTLTSSISL